MTQEKDTQPAKAEPAKVRRHANHNCPVCGGDKSEVILCANSTRKFVCLNPASPTADYRGKPGDDTGLCYTIHIYQGVGHSQRLTWTGKRFNRNTSGQSKRITARYRSRDTGLGFVRNLVPA
jgi:hypothetical protein